MTRTREYFCSFVIFTLFTSSTSFQKSDKDYKWSFFFRNLSLKNLENFIISNFKINLIFSPSDFSKKIKNEMFDEQRLLYSTAWTKGYFSYFFMEKFEQKLQTRTLPWSCSKRWPSWDSTEMPSLSCTRASLLCTKKSKQSFCTIYFSRKYLPFLIFRSSFSEILSRWEPLSSRYSTTAGSSVVWQALLKEEESQTNKQFGKSISKELNHFEFWLDRVPWIVKFRNKYSNISLYEIYSKLKI